MNKHKVNEILQQTKETYNLIASDFSGSRQQLQRWGFDNLKKYIKSGDKVLDIGCGNGRLSKIFDSSVEYLGIDNSEQLIKIAQQINQDRPNINFEVGDVLGLNLPDKSFDLVFCIAVLHHLPSRDVRLQALANIRRVLKSEGTAIIFTWNLFSRQWFKLYWPYILNYKIKLVDYKTFSLKDAFIPWKGIGDYRLRYIHSFTKREMSKLAVTAGLTVEAAYYDFQGQPASVFRGRNLVAIVKK